MIETATSLKTWSSKESGAWSLLHISPRQVKLSQRLAHLLASQVIHQLVLPYSQRPAKIRCHKWFGSITSLRGLYDCLKNAESSSSMMRLHRISSSRVCFKCQVCLSVDSMCALIGQVLQTPDSHAGNKFPVSKVH